MTTPSRHQAARAAANRTVRTRQAQRTRARTLATSRRRATTATRSRSLRLVAPFLALALGLSACAGSDGTTQDTATPDTAAVGDEPAVSAPLPTNDGDQPPAPMGMCAEGEPDCVDTMTDGDATGGASSACLAGAEDCADDPSNGVDVARPIPLTDVLPDGLPLERGTTDGATGAPLDAATADGATLGLAVRGGGCTVLEDVLVIESDTEVRVLALTGDDVEAADCPAVEELYTFEVTLDAPLGDRVLLDLAG
jgi:hypothetical protein